MNEPVVHVVDDDASFRRALVRLLRAGGFETRDFATAAEYIKSNPGNTTGCLILDIRMPGTTGLDLQEFLVKRENAPPVIFLTGHGDIPMSVRAMKAGAVDFLTKPVRREVLFASVRSALARDASMREERIRLRELRARYETLTPREREVFAHVAAGRLNKVIAADLGAAERTIKAHRASIADKLGMQASAEWGRLAEKLDIRQPD